MQGWAEWREAEHAARVASVACAAILLSGRVVHRTADVLLPVDGEHGVRPVVVPNERAHPKILGPRPVPLDEPRLEEDAVVRELFEELGADGKNPMVHVRRVDLGSRREHDPAAFRRAKPVWNDD